MKALLSHPLPLTPALGAGDLTSCRAGGGGQRPAGQPWAGQAHSPRPGQGAGGPQAHPPAAVLGRAPSLLEDCWAAQVYSASGRGEEGPRLAAAGQGGLAPGLPPTPGPPDPQGLATPPLTRDLDTDFDEIYRNLADSPGQLSMYPPTSEPLKTAQDMALGDPMQDFHNLSGLPNRDGGESLGYQDPGYDPNAPRYAVAGTELPADFDGVTPGNFELGWDYNSMTPSNDVTTGMLASLGGTQPSSGVILPPVKQEPMDSLPSCGASENRPTYTNLESEASHTEVKQERHDSRENTQPRRTGNDLITKEMGKKRRKYREELSHLPPQEARRKERRREQNRRAAAKCREKKRGYYDNLEVEMEKEREQQREKEREIKELRSELERMRSILQTHSCCLGTQYPGNIPSGSNLLSTSVVNGVRPSTQDYAHAHQVPATNAQSEYLQLS